MNRYSVDSLITMLREDRNYVRQTLTSDKSPVMAPQRKGKLKIREEKLTEIIEILEYQKEQEQLAGCAEEYPEPKCEECGENDQVTAKLVGSNTYLFPIHFYEYYCHRCNIGWEQ